MDHFEVGRSTNRPGHICGDLIAMAEHELAAFFSAVRDLFGAETAKSWAEEWLQELSAAEILPASVREWQALTVTVLARLAQRLNLQPDSEGIAASMVAEGGGFSRRTGIMSP
jgi:hypothetical protein